MLEVKNLVKKYTGKTVLKGINFSVGEGEIVGFLGLNGAGKSTTMNIITGYISSSDGSVTINGKDVLEYPNETKKYIGYLPEMPPLYMDMTVCEYLNFVYDLKKVKKNKKEHIDDVCKLVKLDKVQHQLIKTLSKGYKQRVGIAQALIGDPKLLILDEPTVGLDPKQIIEIRNLIKELGKTHTIILSSHILTEIQEVCDRIIIIHEGKIVSDDTKKNLTSKDENKFLYSICGNKEDIIETLRSVSGVKEVEFLSEGADNVCEFAVTKKENEEIREEIFSALAKSSMPIMGLRSATMTLEEVFMGLTEENLDQDEATESESAEYENDEVKSNEETSEEQNRTETPEENENDKSEEKSNEVEKQDQKGEDA